MLKTLQGFKDFISRGNVVDLAVGIVIGAAFTALVTSFTESFIEPLIRAAGPGNVLGETGFFTLAGEKFGWANFLNAIITFLLTAAVLYFLVVVPMNRLARRRAEGSEPEPEAPSEEVRLLTEIRDALRVRDGASPPSGATPPPATAPSGNPPPAASPPTAPPPPATR
jgi:large conductance mechanosensitive channel